jgi:hypothetical protein
MDSRKDKRYLHIAGAFGVGGRLTKIGDVPIDLPIETVAPAHLPMVGGRSESIGKLVIDGRLIPSGAISANILEDLKRRELLSVGSARSLAESDPAGPQGPFVSRTISEVNNVAVADGFSLDGCELRMTSSQAANAPFPSVTLGKAAIVGLKLGGFPLNVYLETDAFNSLPTQAEFIAHCNKNGALREPPFSTFLKDDATGRLHQNQSAYLVGSMVRKIEGRLPDGASIEDNGYIIDWPKFGKIILGEILIGPYVRRVTLVRLKHSDTEMGSGCSGGSTWP